MALTVTIDATGIHVPTYEEALANLQESFRGIYGADVYIENDSQDGQLLAIYARALSDCYNTAVAVYNSFSPNTAQGVGLSSAVKINGLARLIPTYSSVDIVLVGDPGLEISNGQVEDEAGVKWNLPASVTIPGSTTITVTATAVDIGAINALPNTINKISTPTRGWASANNPYAAVPGQPVESDATLRNRQQASTALPSQTVRDGLTGALLAITGVVQARVYENNTSTVDADGIPIKSIAAVVLGGDAVAIATQILYKRSLGAGTYGTTSEVVNDTSGNANTVYFFRPTEVPITVLVTLHNLANYTSTIASEISAALVAYFATRLIGEDILYTKLYTPANLSGPDADTFDLVSIAISRSGPTAAANVVIAFNELAVCALANITVVVV